jgi:hypothetical protein
MNPIFFSISVPPEIKSCFQKLMYNFTRKKSNWQLSNYSSYSLYKTTYMLNVTYKLRYADRVRPNNMLNSGATLENIGSGQKLPKGHLSQSNIPWAIVCAGPFRFFQALLWQHTPSG